MRAPSPFIRPVKSGKLVAMLCVRHKPYLRKPPVVLRARLVPGPHMASLHKFVYLRPEHTVSGTCVWCRRRGGTCEDADGCRSLHL